MLCLALALCALAAAACSYVTHRGWLLANRRDHPLTLTLRYTEQCLGLGDSLSDETAFGAEEKVVVRAQDKLWLTRRSYDGTEAECGAIWIRAEGEFDLVLAWNDEPEWDDGDDDTPYSVIVEGPKDELVLYVPDELEQLPPPGAKLLWMPPP